MVIVHFLSSLTTGGLEKMVVSLCNNFVEKNHKVIIILLNNTHLDLLKELNSDIEIMRLPFDDSSIIGLIKRWLKGSSLLIRILKSLNPDVIHSHQYFQDFFFVTLCVKLSRIRVKYFRTIHTSGLFYDSDRLIDKFRLWVEKKALKIFPANFISISKKVFQNNQNLFTSKMQLNNRLIPNGIDLDKFSHSNKVYLDLKEYSTSDFAQIVTYVSRLDVGKNHMCLLKAWSKVIEQYPKAVLCILGDGVEMSKLVKYADKKNISNNVLFLGSTNKVVDFLEITDVAVFPSRFEGFSVALIEKMAMSLPIVASDIDAFKELIVPNTNGLLYEVDNADQLSEYICFLLKDRDFRTFLGQNAYNTSRKFDIKIIAQQTLSYYEDV